jgi:GT2 family glycosyltransferase
MAQGRSYPLVSIIVLNRDGEHHLRRLLPSIRAYTIYPNYEVIVVDNDSSDGSRVFVRSFALKGLRLVRLRENMSFSAANNRGAQEARGDILVFLNNDTEVCYGWLWQLVRTLEADPQAGCAAATLIYPELTEADKGGDWVLPGFSVQHSGIAFRFEGDFLRPYNKGRFLHPLHIPRTDRIEPAVTAAAMAWRADVFRRLGGFDEGYRFGYEDVDLCLRAGEAGHRVYLSGKSFVIHHEFGTQKQTDRVTKRVNRINNIQRFAARWHQSLKAAYWREKLFGEPFLAEHPLTIAVTVTEYHPATTCGDYFTATGLGKALEGMGYRVVYLARRPVEEWYRIPRDVDILLVMMDDYELPKAKVPPGVLTCAWVRNWVDRWQSRPWLKDYDMVLASSRKSLEALQPSLSTRITTGVLRIAVDADLFRPMPADPRYACDLCFVGNIFHVPRDIAQSLRLDPSWRFRFWGRLEAPGHPFEPYHEGRVPYEEVPRIYNSAKIVLEDCTPMCRPWGCINSRTFEAAACGACIVSNPVPELQELFGDSLLIYRDSQELSEIIRHYLANEDERKMLGQKARRVVLDGHTYDHRAREFRDLVAGHFGILGVPESPERIHTAGAA